MRKILLSLLFAAMMVPWVTQAQTPTPATLPYTCGFEDDTENAAWTIVNGTATNKFFIGTAANHGGTKGLYISSNPNGTTNDYNNGASGYVYAQRSISLANSGVYIFAFDWKAYGESCCDYIRAFIVPGNDSLTPCNGTSSFSGISTTALPTGWIAIDGGSALNVQSSWQSSVSPELNLTAGTYKLVFYWRNDGSVGTTPPAAIDNIAITEVTCPAPTNLALDTNVTSTTATITWVDTSGATSWIVEYGPRGFVFGTGEQLAASTTSISLSQLTPNTAYDIYVRGICTSNDTSFFSKYSFRTECVEEFTLPFVEDFESYDASPLCWTYGSTYSSTYPNINTSSKVSGQQSLYMYVYQDNSTPKHTYIVSPRIDVSATPIQTLQTKFYMGVSDLAPNYMYPNTLIVGVMSDSSNFATFYPIDTVTNSRGGYWEEMEVSFENYPVDSVNGKFIAYVSQPIPGPNTTYTYCYNQIYLDDIVVRETPECTRPQSIRIAGGTLTTAGIEWNDPVEDHSSWELAYGPVGFNPDSIDQTQIGFLMSASEDSVGVENLHPDSVYAFYVRTTGCNEPSEWRGPVIGKANSYIMAATGIDTIQSCGITIYDEGGYNYKYNNDCNSVLTILPATEDSLVSINGAVLLASSDVLTIYNGASTSAPILRTITGAGSVVNVDETSSTGALTLKFVSNNNGTNEGFVLNVACIDAPSCFPVEDLRATGTVARSTMLSWNNRYGCGNTPTNYEIVAINLDDESEIGPFTSTETFYLLAGLEPFTNYRVKVRSACDDGSYTAWDSIDIRTECLVGGAAEISGTTASPSYLIPVNNFYRNTYSQQLVLAREMDMDAPGTLQSISFEYAVATPMTVKNNCQIYLGHTTDSVLSSSWMPLDSMKLVYTGSLNCEQGWNKFTFDSLFTYDGVRNLVVTVVDQSDAYNSSSYTFKVHSATGLARYYQTDGTMTVPPSSGSAASVRNNMKFGLPCGDATGACVAPAVHVTKVEANNIDVVWAAGNDETSWNVDMKRSVDSVWTSVLVGTSATSYQFTDLDFSTGYDFRVTTVCSSEEESTIVSKYIPCPAITDLPLREDFETWTTSNIDSCWFKLSSQGASYPSISTQQGSKRVYLYSTTSTYTALILPLIATPINELNISFQMAKASTADQYLQIGVVTDIADISTFTPLAQVEPSGAYTWEYVDVNLDSYAGDGGFIAILSPDGIEGSIYIDNLVVDLIPSCPRVSGVEVSGITSTTVDLIWRSTESANYIVEYDTAGYIPGTGIRVNHTDTTYTIQNLTPGTEYDIYVYNLCSASDTSSNSFLNRVQTYCAPKAVPFTEDFETWTASSTAEIDDCWDRLSDYPTFSYYPYVTSSSTYAFSGTKSMYMYSTNTSYAALILPEFAPAVNTLQLSFVAMKTNTSYTHALHVGVITNPNDISTFVPIDTVAPSVLNEHELFEIPFNTYTGAGGRIAIVSPDNVYSYPYIDNIDVDVIPTCPRPIDVVSVGVHSDTIVADWTERGSATEWQICYGVSPIDPTLGQGTIITGVMAHPYAIPNLSNDSIYDIYVRSICGPGDTSRWSFMPATAAPASYNMPTSGIDTIYMCSGNIYDDGGPAGDYSANSNGILVIYPSLPMNLISLTGSHSTEDNWDYITIYDGAGTSGTELYNGAGDASNLNFVSTTGPLTILFESDGSNQYDGFAFNVQCISNTCPRVQDLQATYVTNTMAVLDWTETGPATEWEIAYDTLGFDVEEGGGNRIIVNTHPCTLNYLTPMTRYDVYVRGVCGAEDTAGWRHIKVTTGYCETPVINEISDSVAGTTYYIPFCSYYNYSYSQQIYYPSEIDTLESGEPMDISSLAFQYFFGTANPRQNVEIYLGHTTDSSFASTSSWIADSMLTKVFEGDIDWNNEGNNNWFEIQLDTVFTYNNTDNLVVVMLDGNGDYSNSSPKLYTHSTGVYNALEYHTDVSPINMASPSTGNRYMYRNNIRFISCDPCSMPSGATVEPAATTATVTFPTVGNYEIGYKETEGTVWSDNIAVVNTNTYTVTGLQPETNYEFRLRTVCDSTTLSGWFIIPITTLELPCVAPMGFSASNVELTSATVAWTDSLNNQEAWKVAYGYGADASAWDTIDVTTASVNLTDLYSNTEYTVRVKAYCSVEADVYSEWSEAFTFRTATCEGVSNITSSAVTANSATINWTPGASQTKWEISYGMEGVSEANGTKVVVENTPAYTIEGLESDLTYDVYVRTVCAEGVYSAWSNKIQFRTTVGINTASADNVKVQIYPNPANSEATISVDGVNGKVEFVLADMNGRMVVTETINCEGSLVKTIDVSNLAKGAYFVHIYNDDFNTTRKLIVK